MKIMVSSTGTKIDDMFDMRFGRCFKFIVYDTDTKEIKVIDNEGIEATGGAGIKAAQQAADINPEAIITGNLGPNAYTAISGTGIKAYRGKQGETVKAVIQMMMEDKLELIQTAGAKNAGKA